MSSPQQTTQIVRLSLERCASLAEAADGIDTRVLRRGDTVIVRTCHSTYTFRLQDPHRGRAAAVGDGSYLEQTTPVRLMGATLSGRGTMLKRGWILLGYKLVVGSPQGEILTSRIRRLWVNGAPVLAAPGAH